jgi:hypothetical protein
MKSDRLQYAAGEPITLTLTVSNPSDRLISLQFMTAQRYDFSLADGQGNAVWRWGAERMFTQMMGQEALPPGASLVFQERCDARLAPGSYRAAAHLATIGAHVSASSAIVITS